MIFEKIRERLETEKRTGTGLRNVMRNNVLDDCLLLIEELEAEYNNGWIPCSERLPEEKGDYLVTCNDGKVRVWWFVVGNDFKCWRSGIHNLEPIAWQPLPQPPKGE